MSIPNLLNKIKSKISIDNKTLLMIAVIVLVGFSSFMLGRLTEEGENDPILIENNTEKIDYNQEKSYNERSVMIENKKFVASKNGTKYYSLGCSGASRIKPENQVWFKDREDAEKSGFTFSSTCK